MKNKFIFLLIKSMFLLVFMVMVGCETGTDSPGTGEVSIDVNMIPVIITGSVSFPSGGYTYNDANGNEQLVSPDYAGNIVNQSFSVSDTELTNKQAAKILQWAYDNNKISDNSDDNCYIDFVDSTIKYGGYNLVGINSWLTYSNGFFTAVEQYENHPVTQLTWYGAILFCNWLTELEDGHINNIVYGIDVENEHWEKGSWEIDADGNILNGIKIDITKHGYRLPTNTEWEYAARYINGIDWLPGNQVTGTNIIPGNAFNIDYKDANNQRFAVYSIEKDSNWFSPVESKKPNALQLYDLCGNMWEWGNSASESLSVRIDEYDRALLGGSWDNTSIKCQVGYKHGYKPDGYSNTTSMRLYKTN